jgi:hypothetical protein
MNAPAALPRCRGLRQPHASASRDAGPARHSRRRRVYPVRFSWCRGLRCVIVQVEPVGLKGAFGVPSGSRPLTPTVSTREGRSYADPARTCEPPGRSAGVPPGGRRTDGQDVPDPSPNRHAQPVAPEPVPARHLLSLGTPSPCRSRPRTTATATATAGNLRHLAEGADTSSGARTRYCVTPAPSWCPRPRLLGPTRGRPGLCRPPGTGAIPGGRVHPRGDGCIRGGDGFHPPRMGFRVSEGGVAPFLVGFTTGRMDTPLAEQWGIPARRR